MADITTWAELDAIRTDLAGTHRLMNDLDSSSAGYDTYAGPLANAGAGWSPIGTFRGTFDGQGFTISGLFINRPTTDYVGLFGDTNGANIANLVIDSPDITGEEYTGALVGYSPNSNISNVAVTNLLLTAMSDFTGGMVGLAWKSGYADCTVEGVLDATGSAGTWDIGGFVGWAGGTFTRCMANVAVDSPNVDYVGGFAGLSGSSVFTQCCSLGNVSGYRTVAGFCAEVYGNNVIASFVDCYSRGSVHSTDYSAGFLCWDSVWGTCGVTIQNCYSTGLVTTDQAAPSGYVGGFVIASSADMTITNCFWDTQTSGQATSAGGTGKTTAQMKQLGTFSAWSIARTTAANPTGGYPFLGWQIGLTNTWLIYGAGGAISPRLFIPIEDKVALELVRNVEMSAGGRAFIDKEGKFHYDSRFGRVV